MNNAIQLFAELILTFLSFVLPIISILLALSQKELHSLKLQYEKRYKGTTSNLKTQLKKVSNKKSGTIMKNYKDIEESLKTLQKLEREEKNKIKQLNPKQQILSMALPLLFSFIFIEIYIIFTNFIPPVLCIISLGLGILSFLYGLWKVWVSITLVIEVRGITDEDSNDDSKFDNISKNVELIYNHLSKTKAENPFLEKVFLSINNTVYKKEQDIIEMEVDKECSLRIGISNQEDRMAKNLEVGFVFPSTYLIKPSEKYTIYNDDSSQIVRFETDSVQGNTHQFFSINLDVTPLSKNETPIKTFIKGENIKTLYRYLKVNFK